MAAFLQFLLLGLAAGSLYALTAHALVLTYKSSGVLNLAQGAFGMVGAFLYYHVGGEHGWPAAVRWGVGLAAPAALAAATHLLLMQRLRRASPLVRLVATLGVLFLLIAVANALFGDQGESVLSPISLAVVHPFDRSITIGADRLWIIAIAFAVTVLLSIGYRYTSIGRRTEAVAENPQAVAALGYSPNLIAVFNWSLGGVLAGAGAILIAPVLLLQPATLGLVVLYALAAALIGRFSSFWWTLAGALGIGAIESLLSRFVEHAGILTGITSSAGLLFGVFSAQAISQSVGFLVIVVTLTVMGRALPLRGELLDRLPAIGTGAIRWPAALAATGCVAVLIFVVPYDWATGLTVSMATGIILLSIVVITGYVGQLSLAQVALAGVGAWAAGRLLDGQHWSFIPALVAGVITAALVGTAVAIPALRTRGVNLAVVTFGLSVCLVELVLSNASVTGGLAGTQVEGLTLFGVSIDPFNTPARYGLVVLIVLFGALVAVANLRRSTSGRKFIAVRGNERAAAGLGINVAATKLCGFALGSGLAGLGGVLLAFAQHSIAYAAFATLASIQAVLMATIGGVGYVLGSVIGATLVPGGLGDTAGQSLGIGSNALQIVSGCLLILVVVANPDGVAHDSSQLLRRLTRGAQPSSTARLGLDHDSTHLGPAAVPRCLHVRNATVRLGGVVAVDRVSLVIRPGEVLGIIGPNGAGKTTMLDAITGFTSLSSGTIALDDDDLTGRAPHQRARAGVQRSFQSLELFEDLSVAENLLVASEPRRGWTAALDVVRPTRSMLAPAAQAAIEDFQLGTSLARRPAELSFGQRRLVAIARSVATNPSILLLDEPAAGLSDTESRELGTVLRRLATKRGVAIALIEHDMTLVMSVCDRVVVLDAGRKIAEGRPAQLASEPAVLAAYLGEHAVQTAASV
jgi:sulfate-transporting ATPase